MTKLDQAVYQGEWSVQQMLKWRACNEIPIPTKIAGSTILLPLERKFGDLESIRSYLEWVCQLPSVVERYHPTIPRLRERRGQTKAHYSHGEIALPDAKWALCETVVLHEFAHHLDRDTRVEDHGPTFRRCLLDLIEAAMGAEVKLALMVSWSDNGV